jgi:RNA polymerase sigma factor (sigma-70 family)
MGMGLQGGVARQLQGLMDAGALGSMDDGELLERFLRRDPSAEIAFKALVDRHGRMVLRICLDVLGDPHEAQDAAQATFFILARKAGSIRKPEALPSWLHGTARRVASRALRESIRRRHHEGRSAEASAKRPASIDDASRGWSELHEELSRLPDRYREPIILCDLFGLTHEQAAGKLGCPPRTLETRLYRGRERLKGRLIRRGVAPSAALVGVAWASEVQAAAPPSWVASTAGAAVRMAGKGGWAAAGEVSATAVRWARAHLKEMVMLKLKLVLATGVLIGLAWQQGKSQTPPSKEPARADPKARQTIAKAVPDAALPKTYTHPITVFGRAFDPEGKPIGGARVYMASCRADCKRVAEGKTDTEGRYEFRDVPLPIERADTVTGEDSGAFQVFGEAEGFGFAFRPVKAYYPLPKPSNITNEPDPRDPPGDYRATDKITLDLNFPAASQLSGTIFDDRGMPLSDVRLEIRGCESLADVDNIRLASLDTFNERDSAPPSMKIRTTDALGRFKFEGMPGDCRFWIAVRAKGFPSYSFHAATTRDPQPDHDGVPVLTGDMKVTLAIPVDVPIKMIYADSQRPAARVAVQAVEGYVSILETSDDQGRALLRLPKGKYRMENWPARGTPYLATGGELVVGEKPPVEPLVYILRRAGELEVTVVDEATGSGLAGVDLWHRTDDGRPERYVMKSWEVATRIAWRDSPRTNDRGKLRVFVEPGKHRFGVGLEAYPKGYEVVEAEGQEVESRAGETSTLKFIMRHRR